MGSNDHPDVTGRRQFLSRLPLAVTGSALVLSEAAKGENVSSVQAGPPAPPLPTIRLGEHRVSRLIAGWNPVAGYSYMGPFMDRHMREYFTAERTVEFLLSCERNGITAWQLDHGEKALAAVRTLRERGSKMQFLCLHSGRAGAAPIEKVVADIAPIAIVHHGGATDSLFRDGKSAQVRDFVKRVRDAGVLAGVSAHNPDCIKRIADEGWPVDLFMTCFYYLTRPPEELQKMAPAAALHIAHYSFFASDPLKMTEVARQVDQPCLGFKILAAGRRCGQKQAVAEAFKFAFEHLKPTDGAIVGMYPRFQDQVRENAQHARQFAAPRTA
jgi:hypothetical protein